MSIRHPIVSITGSSGAGTTTVQRTFEKLFERECFHPVIIEGDSFHRYTRRQMREMILAQEARGEPAFSHFAPEANLLMELEDLFRRYGETGTGMIRHYVHNEEEAQQFNVPSGHFTPWEPIPEGSDLLFYEGLHGGAVTDQVDIARHVDLLIGVVPTINLEWIQKIHRDTNLRGYSTEAVMDNILRRMPDYVHTITPQFTRTHINFQRVPMVDTSCPFAARDIPTPDESMLVIRFAHPRGVDFPYLLGMIDGAFMSRPNTLVVPGGKTDLAMQLIFTPLMWQLMDDKARGERRSMLVRAIGVQKD